MFLCVTTAPSVFEEYRKDVEDLRGWFPLHHYSFHVFATEEDALMQAKTSVAWMMDIGAR